MTPTALQDPYVGTVTSLDSIPYSESFYRTHGWRYAEINDECRKYVSCSDSRFHCDPDLLAAFMDLLPKGAKGLDAGCGAGSRDLHLLCSHGFDAYGLDSVPENIRLSCEKRPHLAQRLLVHDLRNGLCFPDEIFDFVMCDYVIQHNPPSSVFEVIFPELVRALRPGGFFRTIFKYGRGIQTIFDPGYQRERTFQLYDEGEVLECLERLGLVTVKEPVRFTDYKQTHHLVYQMQKRADRA